MTDDPAEKAEQGKVPPPEALGLLTDSADGLQDRARASVTRVGIGSNFWTDLYHHALTTSWPRFMGWSTVAYFVINLAFALLYRLCNARINNAADLDLLSLFFFSVQTLSTVGYGVMAPTGHMANALVSIEALLGMMINALSTGVVFARFSRPRAQIVFSKAAVISKRAAPPVLCLRIANARKSAVLAVDAELSLSQFVIGEGGYPTRIFTPLKLLQSRMPELRFIETLAHPIDSNSPLALLNREQLDATYAQILVTVRGTDEATGQAVLSQHAYEPARILAGRRFVDMVSQDSQGNYLIDYRRLHVHEREPAFDS
ncbi:ATP-sensitive potassium channel protein [Asaia siamensis]|uniref:Inward rectifier potassium channel protein n=1 Tax=Asaia siamensis TaxID=110479 RepID=A0ABQ1LR04_9PROT|nr:ion channel [Asaia siamensis]GBR04254.1 ATP-sensitive potassium transporter [Asaia siamensis NRIC 0323]GGC28409.1 inward rectifier potassium channel protein [Asaia siamensis]